MSAPKKLYWFQQPIGNWRTKKRNVEAIPEIAAAAAKKKNTGREVIVADCVKVCDFDRLSDKDLPADVKKKVLNMGVDENTLDMHFDILCTVLHFKLKHVFKTAEEASVLAAKRAARAERRTELLAASKSKSDGPPARRGTRAAAGLVESSSSSKGGGSVVLEPRILQWLDDMDKELEKQAEQPDSDEEDTSTTKKDNGKEKQKYRQILQEGEQICAPGDLQALQRKYKGWNEKGKGGFGTVYLSKDSGAKQSVAVKVMPHKSVKEQHTNFCEVFFLNKLKHPNVVSFQSAHILPEEMWIIMEFLEGGTLADACKAHSFTEDQVAFVARELLAGVKYLHERNFAHRDIKSPNVMMSTSAEIKLIDFGLCRDISDGPETHMVGSPYWMPPEMIRKETHGLPVDIWSSGICMLELMNGKPPNRDNSWRAMFLVGIGEAPGPSNPNKWSLECQKFIESMLTISQTERPSAASLLQNSFLKKAAQPKAMMQMLQQIFFSQTIGAGGSGLGSGIF